MNSMNDIVITQVANGWIVRMPRLQDLGIPGFSSGMFKEIMQTMKDTVKDAFEPDDILEKIERQNRETFEPDFPKTPTVKDLKDESFYIFKTFPEVLAHLQSVMID